MASMMHQQLIPADPSRTLKVIGAGYSRTGTVSFSLALEILLGGSICHSGTASIVREEAFIKSWIQIMNADPVQEKPIIKDKLRTMLSGYDAVTDAPAVLFSGELAEIFPDAVVICTIRDEGKWWESFQDVAKTMLLWWLDVVFFPMPTLRYFGGWIGGLKRRHDDIYGGGKKYQMGAKHLKNHTEYLKRVIPSSHLHFFNVKEGWAPLCKILDCPIPDVPFPHENDKVAVQKFIESLVKKALLRWLYIFAAAGVFIGSIYWSLR